MKSKTEYKGVVLTVTTIGSFMTTLDSSDKGLGARFKFCKLGIDID